MNHELFLRNWGIMAGGYVCEITRLTIQYLFARELYPVKDQYVVDGVLVVDRFDIGAAFRDSVDPIVKELEYLNATGG